MEQKVWFGQRPGGHGTIASVEPISRTILHVDMDAFFAAVEQRDHPELRGRPVVIGAPPDRRGVVSTASYEARVFGIRSAMPSRTAARLCPHAVFLPVNGKRYREVSEQVMDVFESFTPRVEQLSIDEAFLDVAGATRLYGEPETLARRLKAKVHETTGLTASVGVATNKFLAKLASDLDKPDGLTLVPAEPEAILAFLAPLPVEKLWGVGKAGSQRLRAEGLRTIGDVQRLSEANLQRLNGRALGSHIWRLAHGRDSRSVQSGLEAKSISNEHTFDEDCTDPERVRARLIELTEQVGSRLRRAGLRAGKGHLKLRFEDFSTITRQQTLPAPSRSDRALLACALELFARETVTRPIRLVGFGVSHLGDTASAPAQPDLFREEDTARADEREEALDKAVDRLRELYGRGSVRRGIWGDDQPPRS